MDANKQTTTIPTAPSDPANILTKREYICIVLRVPESGDPEIDRLIAIARKRDVAAAALTGIMANPANNTQNYGEDARLAKDAANDLLSRVG